jgi:hypothetical protein
MIKALRFCAMVIVVCAAGILAGRSQAQPEEGQQVGPPIFLNVGGLRVNPTQVSFAYTYAKSFEKKDTHDTLAVAFDGTAPGTQYFTLNDDGRAEVLLEWIDAHSTVLRLNPPAKK